MFRVFGGIVAVSMGFCGSAFGEAVDSKAAKKLLFSPKGADVRILADAGLSETDAATLKLVMANIPYYGAAAFAPDEGLQSEATQAVSQHHSISSASAAALEQCNKVRKGGAACVVAAEVVPRRYKERDLQLSVAATAAFRKQYRKLRGEKAFAISPKTGGWAFYDGVDAGKAAVNRCNQSAGTDDCTTVIAD